MKRRAFVRNTGLSAAGLAFFPATDILSAAPPEKIKVGVIGVGLRGQNYVKLLLRRNDVDVVAVADVDQRMLGMTADIFSQSGKTQPKVFTGDPFAWKKMLELKGLQTVIIATPWEWHKPMIISSLEAGLKYVGTEVVLGINLEDHWDVVRAAEKYSANVMMLENVCYRRDVMAVLNMVRQNVFGELLHVQGGYQHDLRDYKFNDGKDAHGKGVEFGEKAFSEARWRTNHSLHRNGDLYPTHGIGPIAQFLNINRGNRFTSLNSFASKARSLHKYIVDVGGENHPNAKLNFKLGDVVTTNISCANGETVLLQHDTNSPRPYSLGFRVQGTNGLWMDVSNTIYVEHKSKPHEWDSATAWLEKYDHPLWKKYANDAEGAGHGGMDFFVLHAFIESIKRRQPTPLDVYDAAAWSAITPLSEQSIELGNETMDFPDFTGGQWMDRKPIFAFDDQY